MRKKILNTIMAVLFGVNTLTASSISYIDEGGGAVDSVSSGDSIINVTPTIGDVVATINIANIDHNGLLNTHNLTSDITHSTIGGLQGGVAGEYYHLTLAQYSGYNNTNWDTAYGWGDHALAGYLTANQTITLSGAVTGSGTTAITTQQTGKITMVIDGGGDVVSTGVGCAYTVTDTCTLTGTKIMLDVSGTVTLDIWATTTANVLPVDADSITNSHEPSITAQVVGTPDEDISDWSDVTMDKGTVLLMNVDSCDSATRIVLEITTTR